MSDESKYDVDTGHDYDGIREFDNPLPNWWLAIFFLTTVFGYGYWLHYHVAKTGTSILAEFAADQAEAARKLADSGKGLTDELLVTLSKDPATTSSGEKTFKQLCVQCHGEQAEGKVGPNLTDEFWLHGNKPTEIYKSVAGGYVAKGMPSWLPTIGPERTRQVVSYVLTRRGLNLPGKEPQGERIGAFPK
jgi:cytochrome c oxidase cbb3-type subunit 3